MTFGGPSGPALPRNGTRVGRLILRRQTRAASVHEEVVSFVVHENEGREVLYFDFPNRFHSQLGILQHLDLLDVLLRQDRGGTADTAEVKPAVLLTRIRDLSAAISFREHDHRATVRLKEVHVAVHP